jgi:hypothetical protein
VLCVAENVVILSEQFTKDVTDLHTREWLSELLAHYANSSFERRYRGKENVASTGPKAVRLLMLKRTTRHGMVYCIQLEAMILCTMQYSTHCTVVPQFASKAFVTGDVINYQGKPSFLPSDSV